MEANMEDLNLPIALRRTRRSSVGIKVESSTTAPFSELKTPHKRKRIVRFSDPGPHLSSGLTPMIRRTSIATPKRRRSSTPLRSSGNGATTPSGPTLQHTDSTPAHSLHQTAEGRVERRSRRSGLRDMLNKLEQEKRRKEHTAKTEIATLRAQVKARDREIYELQNATVVIDTERIWDLEQQIYNLREELARRARANVSDSRAYSWKTAAPDPFVDDLMDMTADEEQFGSTTMKQLQASTPERTIISFRSSFPTPPPTSPIIPATPCMRISPPLPMSHTGVQAELPDPEKEELEEELASMHQEVSKLTATLETYAAVGARLSNLLRSVNPDSTGTAATSPMQAIESQVQSLLQSMSDRNAALGDLTSTIAELGFPGADASEMITSLTSGFRAARLELEYLTPGEIALPLTSHGAEVLDLLLARLRILAKKSKEDDDAIDEYHALEQSLRKQLDARVSVMNGLKAEMSKAQKLMDDKNNRIRELEIGTDRLKGAVDGYIRDMSELEKLVERMEQENKSSTETHLAEQKSKDEELAAKDVSIADLEGKIAEAVLQTGELLKEMCDQEDDHRNQAALLNQQHGAALALRDARVTELRGEVGRVNESLRVAHETVRELRLENSGLKTRLDDERIRAKAAVDSMKGELQRVLQMSQDFLSSPKSATPETDSEVSGKRRRETSPESPSGSRAVVRAVGYLAGDLVRIGNKKMRRRYDSGLGMLNEDEVDI
ncbi:hypothetical protein PT974_03840 [Cladobotryum mycophilum]|uniref:Uncharacterized protein n=1 Tax=Cladobotryum mycophilum TaxID=491253 RepID=A0ABR0STT0_9HYPO